LANVTTASKIPAVFKNSPKLANISSSLAIEALEGSTTGAA
jgi:hypothetical protein